jgi:hypothetical protein
MQTIDEFLAEWTTAELAADISRLDALIDHEFTGVGPLGFVLPKDAWLARHRQGDLKYEAFDLDEIQPRRYGDTAVVIARHVARATYHGHPTPQALRATLLLISDADRWRLAAIQLSFIAGTPGAPPIPGAAAGN